MLVIDSSAVVAILLNEPEAAGFLAALRVGRCCISSANLLEAEVVILRRLGPDAVGKVRALLGRANAQIVPLDAVQVVRAIEAYERFGKGRHAERLGLFDCAAYALAKSLDAPLLYKGNDFAQTDLASALNA